MMTLSYLGLLLGIWRSSVSLLLISRDRILPGRKNKLGEMCSKMPLVGCCGEMWERMG